MDKKENLLFLFLAIAISIGATTRILDDSWQKEAVDKGVARYHPDTGQFEWTNVRILPQWENIKRMVEYLDEQRKNARFGQQQIQQGVPSIPSQNMPQGYEAGTSYKAL